MNWMKFKEWLEIKEATMEPPGWEAKMKAIEDFDKYVAGRVLRGLKGFDECKVLLMPDHRTPIALRTHTYDPVPIAVLSSGEEGDDVKEYDEFSVESGSLGIIEGHLIMEYLVG